MGGGGEGDKGWVGGGGGSKRAVVGMHVKSLPSNHNDCYSSTLTRQCRQWVRQGGQKGREVG